MAAKGSIVKQTIKDIILQVFPNSFVNDKEIRIPAIENGERIEIKLTLTAAKDLLSEQQNVSDVVDSSLTFDCKPSEEEKEQIVRMLEQLREGGYI